MVLRAVLASVAQKSSLCHQSWTGHFRRLLSFKDRCCGYPSGLSLSSARWPLNLVQRPMHRRDSRVILMLSSQLHRQPPLLEEMRSHPLSQSRPTDGGLGGGGSQVQRGRRRSPGTGLQHRLAGPIAQQPRRAACRRPTGGERPHVGVHGPRSRRRRRRTSAGRQGRPAGAAMNWEAEVEDGAADISARTAEVM